MVRRSLFLIVLWSSSSKRFVGMQNLLHVRDVVSIDSFELLNNLVIVAGTVDESPGYPGY